jgi:hypothetical protein
MPFPPAQPLQFAVPQHHRQQVVITKPDNAFTHFYRRTHENSPDLIVRQAGFLATPDQIKSTHSYNNGILCRVIIRVYTAITPTSGSHGLPDVSFCPYNP